MYACYTRNYYNYHLFTIALASSSLICVTARAKSKNPDVYFYHNVEIYTDREEKRNDLPCHP